MKSKDRSIEEMDRKQRESEIIEQNLKKILEEEVNQKALKIGRKVLDEMYLHNLDKIEINIRKSEVFDWLITVDVGEHPTTCLENDEIEFIRKGNLQEEFNNSRVQGIAQYRRSQF